MTYVSGWREGSVARCLSALKDARSSADRGSLLRTLAWLKSGRVDLVSEGIELLPSDADEQIRFGYSLPSSATAVSLRDRDGPEWWPDLSVDPSDRRGLRTGSPDATLLRLTDLKTYRTIAQKAAIRALLNQPPGSSLLASMPTGAGKSLVFQMAALHGRETQTGACVAVIVPTIALALDHQRSLQKVRGLENSIALTSDFAPNDFREKLDSFRRGEVPILLLGPEMALRDDVQAALGEAASQAPAAFGLNARLTHLVVDEAHIVETWGRNFRPDFQRLPTLLRHLRDIEPCLKLVLLSATLPPAARKILKRDWGAASEWCEVDAKVARYEHDVLVSSFRSDEERDTAVDYAVDRLPRPTIVYTTEVADAARIHQRLVQRGYARVGIFTGESTTEERQAVVKDWASDQLDLVVATSAFGMGVDKPDVRSIIHACLPEGPSRWYQEIGRASRDGGQGIVAMLFTDKGGKNDDVGTAIGLSQSGWLTRDIADRRWLAMKSQGHTWVGERARIEVDLDSIREGLQSSRSSDYNRTWNRSLLMLMQRAGTLEVMSMPENDGSLRNIWTVEVKDTRLLSAPETVMDAVFALRDREATEAKATFAPFLKAVRNPESTCLIQLAFELIEPNSPVPPCGHCPHCRLQGVPPARDLSCGGLNATWRESCFERSTLSRGIAIVSPTDPTFTREIVGLIEKLNDLGVEQWIVPDNLAQTIAENLSPITGVSGLVMTFSEWTEEAAPLELPTALLIPEDLKDASSISKRFFDWIGGHPKRSGLIVMDPTSNVGGRRLDQWASRFAPVSEATLTLRPKLKEGSP
jgi:ATP-dependent DNA helicase RecQ